MSQELNPIAGGDPKGPRSAGSINQRRVRQPWPKDRRFRILSIDGGGIKGIFPAAVLAGLEADFTGGESIARYFDLIAGTSTGGIIGLGLGAGYPAKALLDLYRTRGGEIFPPLPNTLLGRFRGLLRDIRQYARYAYNQEALRSVLVDQLGGRLFGESSSRLCIPSFDGKYSEVAVFKTPHHPDYKIDRFESMVNVGLATSAAPTYFRPLKHGEYTLVDGGVWSNNPIMLAVIEAMICFEVERGQIDVFSIGCGSDLYVVSEEQSSKGGIWQWKNIMEAAMRLQSLATTNQARLILGPPAVLRIDGPTFEPKLKMDDFERCVTELIPAAAKVVSEVGARIEDVFLQGRSAPFIPVPVGLTQQG